LLRQIGYQGERAEQISIVRTVRELLGIAIEGIEEQGKMAKVMNIPMCWKCASNIIQPVFGDEYGCSEIVGCKDMTKAEWEKGNRKDSEGRIYQHDCPLIKEIHLKK